MTQKLSKIQQIYHYQLNKQEKKIVGLSALGGMLEFYDFVIYGIFSLYFASQFFPNTSHLISVIQSYVIFVLGYIARPIGGIIFSHIGDEYGRKKVLIITVVLMGVASIGIAILPTYQYIGIAAPIILLALRMLQGLALGGELPSTYVYISESMPHRRGYGFGITMSGVNTGLLLGMLVNIILTQWFNQTQLTEFAWRIPFIIGGLLCIISFKIRKTLHETQAFNKIQDKPKLPLIHLLTHYPIQVTCGTALTSLLAATVIIAVIFMPTYLNEILHIDTSFISIIMPLVTLANVITIFLFGGLIQSIGVLKVFKIFIGLSIITIGISYYMLSANFMIFIPLIALGIIEGMAAIITPLLLTYLFPANVRLTGVALCYNLGFTIFGGFAPILITYLINHSMKPYPTPAIYLYGIILLGIIGFRVATKFSHEKI